MKDIKEIRFQLNWDGKKHQITIGTRTIKVPKHEKAQYELQLEDAFTFTQQGFGKVIEWIQQFTAVYKGDAQAIIRYIAINPMLRIRHFETVGKMPRYAAQKVVDMLLKSNACVPCQSGAKKTEDFGRFLLHMLPLQRTLGSITSLDRSTKYKLPSDIDLMEMSIEQLQEEVRVCQLRGGRNKRQQLNALEDMLKARRSEHREANRVSEIDQLKFAAKEIEEEDRMEERTKRERRKRQRQQTVAQEEDEEE